MGKVLKAIKPIEQSDYMTLVIIIFFILSQIQTTYGFTFNNVDPTKLHLSYEQKSLAPYGANIGRIILYCTAIGIVILTRLKWTKHGRKVTKPKIIVESIFYLALSSIVIFDSLYHVGVPILYLVPYLILFFGLQQYSYLHSNRLMSFWKEPNSASIYVKGGTHIHAIFVLGTASRIIISILFIGSLFGPSQHGIIYASDSTVMLATIVFDFLLMISVGLLIGINRRNTHSIQFNQRGKRKHFAKVDTFSNFSLIDFFHDSNWLPCFYEFCCSIDRRLKVRFCKLHKLF